MNSKRIMAVILTAVLMVAGLAGGGITADAESTIQITGGATRNIEAEPGKVTHVKLPIVAVGEYILNPSVTAEPESGAPFSVTGVKLTKDNLEGTVPGISTYEATNLEFDVDVKDTAKIKDYGLTFTFTYNGANEEGMATTYKIPLDVNIQILTEKTPSQLTIDQIRYDENLVAIGGSFDLSFQVKNEGEIKALNTFVSIDYGDTGMVPGYTLESIKVGDLTEGVLQNVHIPINVLPTATEGLKTLKVNMTYKDSDGTEYSTSRNLYITVLKSGTGDVNDANLILESSTYSDGILAGSDLTLQAVVTNNGAETARDVSVSIVSGVGVENSIIPDFTGDAIAVSNIEAGESKEVEIPLIITKDASSGLRAITLQVKYLNSEDKQCTAVTTVYVSVAAAASTEIKNEIAINGVTQSPTAPVAGERMSVSFKIENKGTGAISDVKMSAKNLSSTGFEPVSSEPYQNVGTIEAGSSRNVTMNFMVGSNITEGMNTLTLTCTYTDASGAEHSEDTMVYILNVVNDGGTVGRPRLIISNFSTVPDPEKGDLRAGSQFEFVLEIENTHSSVSARNIKVTLSQTENIFTVTEGSSSIFISSIAPGETSTNTFRMKVKNDATTKAYPLEITIQYDYDGMKATDTSDGSETVKETLNLQAVENARPDVQNIIVGTWELPTVNQSTTMNFDFYNKGQSTLNNVEFRLEGDFQFESGPNYTYYLGNIQGGSAEYGDISVIPLVEGTAYGTLICMFEDSNGDQQEISFDFEATVQGEYIPEYPDDPGILDPTVPVDQPKEPILPLWMFLCIQAGILVIGIPVTRKIVLSLYRRRLMKQEEEE